MTRSRDQCPETGDQRGYHTRPGRVSTSDPGSLISDRQRVDSIIQAILSAL